MEKGKDLLKAYLTGLKESCSSVCLWSLQVRHKNSTHGRITRKAIKFLSRTNNNKSHVSKIQQTSRTSQKKNEASERSDTRFKGSYELMCNYTKHIPKKLLVWKPYFDNIISLQHTNRDVVKQFIEPKLKQINTSQPSSINNLSQKLLSW